MSTINVSLTCGICDDEFYDCNNEYSDMAMFSTAILIESLRQLVKNNSTQVIFENGHYKFTKE